MKLLIGTLCAISLSGLLGNELLATQEEPQAIVYLVDPKDPEAKDLLPDAEEKASTKKKKPKSIDDLIDSISDGGSSLSKRQQRVVTRIEQEEKSFIDLMDQFVRVEFDPSDDKAKSEFNTLRDKVVKLVMSAPTERDYYQRLYLVNSVYLEHPDDLERFASLDLAMRDAWMGIEQRRKRIRQVVMGVTTIAGAAAGGYLSSKWADKIWPVVADGKGLTFLQGLGKGSVIVIGAGVGAAAGAYIGFLGSDLILKNQRDFVDPIDGNEDLRDILDLLDQMPS